MPISIVPHAESWKDAVESFNARMRAGGSRYGFYVAPEPPWLPKREPSQPVWREYYLVVEDGREVRGGYALKPQEWWVRGSSHTVTDWQGPFSEGAVSNRYGALGLRMLRDMVSKRPLLYSWGHGGEDAALFKLIKGLGWMLYATPLMFRIVRPAHFARKNGVLRVDPRKRMALDALAFTGLASIGGRALTTALRISSMKSFGAKAEVVPEFGPWADPIWDRAKHDYAAIAVRDARAMNTLVPRTGAHYEWSEQIRLRVRDREGNDLGWAVVCKRRMENHPRFGDLHVGTIVDALAPVRNAGEVIHAAYDWLERAGVELVIANQSDPRWIRAFEENAFLRYERGRYFCAAPPLVELLSPWEDTRERIFLTNMDGHGPMGL
ncbi:hypothetical protein [Sandaracinus amylolyticus]|uniref:hypothetical protein n=1 Tax=Sandaracinus amylolyticus TaxID=927083 RepID=UPI001F2600C4|nr:hypothetical protein [Sandaracinus amylolyticus]UJR83306.1 Hypothetical protein I5071_53740 [Sandaracinus amylolyticus]